MQAFFYTPTTEKPVLPNPVARHAAHPSHSRRTRFHCRKQTAADTAHPSLPTINRKRQPSGKKPKKRKNTSPTGTQATGTPASITCPDHNLNPIGYRHFPKPPVPATNGRFLHGRKNIRTGKTSRTARRNGGKNREYGSMQTMPEPFITSCPGKYSDECPFP